MNDPGTHEDELTLELLDVIEQRSDVSQRHLAKKLGIAVGLTNAYLKRCARKGYVKVKEVPANRYLYFVTPKGFAEKSRLTARFLSTSLKFYRQSAESCDALLELCQRKRWKRLIFCGASDLSEIAYTRSSGHALTVVGIYDPDYKSTEFLSLPVWRGWDDVAAADAYLITGLNDPLRMYRAVLAQVTEKERVLVPRVLGLEAAIKDR